MKHFSNALLAKKHTCKWLNIFDGIEQLKFTEKLAISNKVNFLTNKQNFKNFAEISMPFCNLEVKIRIESLAMQNCESRNCQFSGKSRNIQNCFWRPSPQFTSYTWISMTLDILCCRQKLKTCMKQMFSKHFKTFHISQSHVLKSKT